MTNQITNHKSQHGISLPEVIVALTIFLIISGAVVVIFSQQSTVFNQTLGQLTTVRQGERALRMLTRELRATVSGVDRRSAIRTATDRTIEFTADIDGDNVPELIHYTINGEDFVRTLTHAQDSTYTGEVTTSIVAEHVSANPIFSYYTSPDTQPLDPTLATTARVINVTLTLITGKAPTTLSELVTLRNQ